MGDQPALAVDYVKTVTLDGAGAGDVLFGPPEPGQRWAVTTIAVDLAGGIDVNPDAQATVYLGEYPAVAIPRNLRLHTLRGGIDVADGAPSLDMPSSHGLRIAWIDGAPGVLGTVRITVEHSRQ